MWFLNATTRRLEAFTKETDVGGSGYAILSHRWAEEEVTFDEIHLPEAKSKQGYRKIEHTCVQAVNDGYDYVWIDTCCIDKRSSAELSEAINSMFRWYRNAQVCYVYLIDFDVENESSFRNSAWWSRGWTLQELIAPETVKFYDQSWKYYGNKAELIIRIHDITKIDFRVLRDRTQLFKTSVAKRMSWAAHRTTSRGDDQAYALMGLFNVNMPLLYGEGAVKAFYRLQEEIIRTSAIADHSILAWMTWEGAPHLLAVSSYSGYSGSAAYQNLLAPSPHGFRHAHDIISWDVPQAEEFTLTSRGLRMTVSEQIESLPFQDGKRFCAMLNCRYSDSALSYIVISLEKRLRADGKEDPNRRDEGSIYDRWHRFRVSRSGLFSAPAARVQRSRIELTLAREPFIWPQFEDRVEVKLLPKGKLLLIDPFPADGSNPQSFVLELDTSLERYSAKLKPAFGVMVLHSPALLGEEPFIVSVDRLFAANQGPRLLVGVFDRCGVESLRDVPVEGTVSLAAGEDTWTGKIGKTIIQISAQIVMVAGDLLWSLEIRQDARNEREVSLPCTSEERALIPGFASPWS